jgi:hypothetical protein
MSFIDSEPGRPSILGVLFIGVVVVAVAGFVWMLIVGAADTARRNRLMRQLRRRGRPATATVVEMNAHVTDDDTVWSFVVDYPAGGGEQARRVQLLGSVAHGDHRHPGDEITIRYDPLRPWLARAESPDPDEGFGFKLVVVLVVGAALCTASALAR